MFWEILGCAGMLSWGAKVRLSVLRSVEVDEDGVVGSAFPGIDHMSPPACIQGVIVQRWILEVYLYVLLAHLPQHQLDRADVVSVPLLLIFQEVVCARPLHLPPLGYQELGIVFCGGSRFETDEKSIHFLLKLCQLHALRVCLLYTSDAADE